MIITIICMVLLFIVIYISYRQRVINKFRAKAGSNVSAQIISQEKRKREFSKAALDPIVSIRFEELTPPVFRPTFAIFDDKSNIYTLDYSNFTLHKFCPEGSRRYGHFSFGKGRGHGPGELSHVEDIKIDNGKIYITEQTKGSIEIYGTDGSYIKSIKLDNHAIPRKISLTERDIIIEPFYSGGPLFYSCDQGGKIIRAFGEYIDKSYPDNLVYNDNTLSESFNDGSFFFLPYYLGYVGLYKEDRLVYAKATIDGIEKRPKAINKKITDNMYADKIEHSYETASWGALFFDCIIIKASDLDKKIDYWDVYEINNFDYIMSIKDPPRLQYIANRGDFLAGINDDELKIYDTKKIFLEIKERRMILDKNSKRLPSAGQF